MIIKNFLLGSHLKTNLAQIEKELDEIINTISNAGKLATAGKKIVVGNKEYGANVVINELRKRFKNKLKELKEFAYERRKSLEKLWESIYLTHGHSLFHAADLKLIEDDLNAYLGEIRGQIDEIIPHATQAENDASKPENFKYAIERYTTEIKPCINQLMKYAKAEEVSLQNAFSIAKGKEEVIEKAKEDETRIIKIEETVLGAFRAKLVEFENLLQTTKKTMARKPIARKQ